MSRVSFDFHVLETVLDSEVEEDSGFYGAPQLHVAFGVLGLWRKRCAKPQRRTAGSSGR